LEWTVALFSRAFVRKRMISLATTISFSATSLTLAHNPPRRLHSQAVASQGSEKQFLFENDLAVSNITRDMLINPSGDVDQDFVTVMIPQHRAAIDLARAELKYGHNQELQRLARSIVVQQQQQISLMHRAVGEVSPTGPDEDPFLMANQSPIKRTRKAGLN
jgi:uncharacterized protein (DUF305 family)